MTEIPDDIRDLLDELATAKDHVDNDLYRSVPYWHAEFEFVARQLADAWANETADSHE